MSSWLARSLTNSLRIDDNDVVADPPAVSPTSQPHEHHDNAHGSEPEDDEDEEDQGQGRGVKEDLDEIKQTLTRQFWGMASFLAPPPPSNSNPSSPPSHDLYQDSIPDHSRPDYSDVDQPDPEPIGSDFGGNHQPELEEYAPERAVGITDEVLSFAFNIAMHPETWLDFPIDEEDDPQDFDMSDAQQEHAVAIERLIPRLNALRIELCPCHMSESYFWKVYFVLLHSRLNKEDASILSTPQVMEARAMWMQELHKQTKPEFEFSRIRTMYSKGPVRHDDFACSLVDDAYSDDLSHQTYGYETTSLSMLADKEIEKHTIAVESSETHFIDKSVIQENTIIKNENKDLKCGHSTQIITQDYVNDDDDIDWPEEDSDLGEPIISIVNEEDISFSDLEDDDYGIKPITCNTGSKVA
ncbi:hypothetical protein HN51_053022 [Arachis hypogaea]|uniref:uncharacterized protein LOC107606352 n=1 Tax=Arachis ipaensis TaxID=130454 RepID=UPI0007AFDA72|nr:uncharacterized protein LOC107606352 [Arachis ipaensis]XP_025666631.1 uncharacterized protein LOC112764987 [Arachis hypogaea]QHN94444.1 uncharacterized protein DS421_17g601280 [Arachis hypogaea]